MTVAEILEKGVTMNLNDYVWVRLTDKGKALLAARDQEWSQLYAVTYGLLATAEKQESDYGGWSRWQLWSLIQEFGPAIYHGCTLPFETTIRLTEPESGSGL